MCFNSPPPPYGDVEEGILIGRENRFLSRVLLRGREIKAFVPNSGRLEEALMAGRRVALLRREGKRKTPYDLFMSYGENSLIWVDSRAPSFLLPRALGMGLIDSLSGFSVLRTEYPFMGRRIDFALSGEGLFLVETKSVTLVRDGIALFPDAPTERGRRHLEVLMEAKRRGIGAMILFFIQREDGEAFSPNNEIDPEFGSLLRRARREGVEVRAIRCRIIPYDIEPEGEAEVIL